MPVPTALLANEAGVGRGHIVKLRQVAAGLGPRATCVAALGRMTFKAELAPFCREIVQAPPLHFTPEAVANPRLEGTASWADYLAAMGLAREQVVRHGLAWWRDQIIARDAAILVADYAPLAMRAAQGLKDEGWAIEIISVGTGYGVPPANLPAFPQLLPDYGRVVHPEATLLALLNRVGAEQGLDPLPHLPALYRADLVLAQTFEFLDPYRKVRTPGERVPPHTRYAPDLAGAGDEVFIYFSTRELEDPAVVDAVCALPLPRRGYLPEAKPETIARLAASGMIVEPAPLGLAAITARSRLMLHAGQHGILCLGALAGLPQMALPQHLEHLFHARRAGQQGILHLLDWRHRRKDLIMDMAMRLYHDQPMQARAVDFARTLRHEADPDPATTMHDRLTAVIERATAAL
jgi:hypothetical protein